MTNFVGAIVTVQPMDQHQRERGVIVRDDDEPPYVTIIKLESGRYVLATECRYRILAKSCTACDQEPAAVDVTIGPATHAKVEIAELHGGPYDGHQVGLCTNDDSVLAIPDMHQSQLCHCYQRAAGVVGLQYMGLREDHRRENI